MRLFLCCLSVLTLWPEQAWAIDAAQSARGMQLILIGMALLTLVHTVLHTGREIRKAKRLDVPYVVKGISGWLLFFFLTSSLMHLLSLVVAVASLLKATDLEQAMMLALLLYHGIVALYALVYLYGMYALCRVKPGAVKLNKILLVLDPLLTAVFPLFLMVCLSMVAVEPVFTEEKLKHSYSMATIALIVRTTLLSLIWFAYLFRSKRVRNTWAVHEPPSA